MSASGTTTPEVDFQQEVRLAVVMYGGISLAIYMNGIAQELLSLVRSTAAEGNVSTATRFRYKETDLAGTGPVYRDLARFLSSLESGVEPGSNVNRYRFVVDILSGTSAGGLNGMFLAKALACESPDLSALEGLWINEGDIGKLLNDARSLAESPEDIGRTRRWRKPDGPVKPTSLLNSDRMYARLYQALGNMNPAPGVKPRALVDQLDLYMTATDLKGLKTQIFLSDRIVEEMKHKTVFHFRYLNDHFSVERSINDFVLENDGFMAFVGRATSSIVPAFEPMRLSDIGRSTDQDPNSLYSRWDEFYRPYWRNTLSTESADPTDQEIPKISFLKRDFGDGGYLDNRPFTYATRALSERVADLPVIRKLYYVEPDPIDIAEDHEGQRPNFLQHAMAAGSLPSIDAIRDDIEVVRQRNEVIDRLSRIIDHVERVFVNDSNNWQVNLGATSARRTSTPTPSQLGYLHLRVADVTDSISEVMANQLGFGEESPYRPTIRQLVRVWRDATYQQGNIGELKAQGKPDTRPERFGEFLEAFDFGYWERCINFLHRRINKRLNQVSLPTEESAEAKRVPTEAKQSVRRAPPTTDGRTRLLELKRCLNEAIIELRKIRSQFVSHRDFAQVGEGNALGISLRELSQILRHPHDDEKLGAATEVLTQPAHPGVEGGSPTRLEALTKLSIGWQTALIDRNRAFRHELEEKIDHVAKNGEGAEEVALVKSWYQGYELVDELVLPVTYATGALESNTVDIHRISPLDALSLLPKDPDQVEAASSLARAKLVGTTIGHFGAFFDVGGRARDILWGRLDAAERLIKTLTPDTHLPERTEFRNRAHLSILATPPVIPPGFDTATLTKAQLGLDMTLLRLMLFILDNSRQDRTARWNTQTSLESLKSEASQTLDALEYIPNRERKAISAKLMGLLEQPGLAQQVLRSSFAPPLAVENAQKVDLTGRTLNITGKMFDGIHTNKKWGMVSFLGSTVSAIGKVLVPNSVEDILWKHWFGLLVILSGVWILLGTVFNSPEISSSGATLLLIVLVFGYILRKIKLLASSDSVLTFLARFFGTALIVLLIALFGFTLFVLFKYKETILPGFARSAPWIYVGLGGLSLIFGIGLLLVNRSHMREENP